MVIGLTNFALQSFFIIGSSSFKAPEFHSSDKNYKLGDIVVETSCFQSMFPGFVTSRNVVAAKILLRKQISFTTNSKPFWWHNFSKGAEHVLSLKPLFYRLGIRKNVVKCMPA